MKGLAVALDNWFGVAYCTQQARMLSSHPTQDRILTEHYTVIDDT
jgi:hypothetical protein